MARRLGVAAVMLLLRAAGHQVHAPTLTGVSDRAHLLSPQVGLSTHIQDVVSLIEAYDARDVVLVGHSYAGQVVTGVADRVGERLAKRIHLGRLRGRRRGGGDRPAAHHHRRPLPRVGGESGRAGSSPVRKLSVLGVTEQADLDWLSPRLTPHRGSPTPSRCG